MRLVVDAVKLYSSCRQRLCHCNLVFLFHAFQHDVDMFGQQKTNTTGIKPRRFHE